MPPNQVPEPWASFLDELDSQLAEDIQLSCVGGFAVTAQYGLERPTSDIDVLSIVPENQSGPVLELAGEGSELYKKYGVYIQQMGGMITLPENYEERRQDLFSGQYKKLRLVGLDPYDLGLSKLERSNQTDRDDVKYLFRVAHLDIDVLQKRYRSEQRPYLSNEAKHDLTITLWVDMLKEQTQEE